MRQTDQNDIDFNQMDFDFLSEPKPEEDQISALFKTKPYKLLIVDDDDEIHKITKIALRNLKFENSSVEMAHTYSMRETKDYLAMHLDVAVILLDVVMESDDAGLQLVKFIRHNLNNDRVRIILRTGQPGVAPETKVMMEYDINDYRNKTDLTAVNLISAVTGCLRNYRDIMKVNTYKNGLERVINSTSLLFNYDSLGLSQFLNGILEQLTVLINSENSLVLVNRHFDSGRLITHEDQFMVIAATGEFVKYINTDLETVERDLKLESIVLDDTLMKTQSKVDLRRKFYLGVHKPTFRSHTESYIYVINGDISPENERLLEIFLKNLSLSLDNFLLEQDTDEALYEMLSRISSIVEARDGETGTHVYRVSDVCGIIAKYMSIEKNELRDFKVASMMHDVGKIAIKDAVLLKPGSLTPEEFEMIKKHTVIGGRLFKRSNHQLLRMAEKISTYHHERWDGSGYPEGLSGEAISLYARIVTIVDVFDALTHDRVYKKAWPLDEAIQFLKDQRGKIFDPHLIDLFFEHFDEIMAVYKRYEEKIEVEL